MSEAVTIPSNRQSSTSNGTPTDPAVVEGSRARVDEAPVAATSEEPTASGSSELELSDDDFVLLESARPAPIPRSILRAALVAAAAPSARAGATSGRREGRSRARSESAPDTRPTGGLGAPLPQLPVEPDDAPSSWDEESEVTAECLTAIAAEAVRASRPSDPFLLVTPLARKRPPQLREHAAAASVRPSASRASRPSFSRVHPCLPPHVAAPLEGNDPDDADTLPVPVRAPAAAANTSAPAAGSPFARTTAEPAVTPWLGTPRTVLPRATSPSASSGSMTPIALHATSDGSQFFSRDRPRAIWLLASAAAGALGAVVGMQALGPSLRAQPPASRAIVTNAEAPAPARADADGAAPVDEIDAVEIGPPLPPAGPPPPPRRPPTGSARPQHRPAGGQTARSLRQPHASAPASAAKKRTPEQAVIDAQLRAVSR